MRDFGRRLLIGLAVVAGGATAVGYAFIAGGIASPVRGDRAVLGVPEAGTATATVLDDGRPVFVVNDPERGIWVLDAQGRQRPGSPPVLVAWCPATRTFADPADGSVYAPDGELRFGPAEGGLVAFATRPAPDDPGRVIVGSDTAVQGREVDSGAPSPTSACEGAPWVVHQPAQGEVFDPSVAIREEPLGWVWLDGRLEATDGGGVRLCDRTAADCATWADVVGIDPATLDERARAPAGLFIGLVRDGAVDGLMFVPDLEEAP